MRASRKLVPAVLCTLVTAVAGIAPAAAQQSHVPAGETAVPASRLIAQLDIPYDRFTLPNGLRVVVSTDRKAPIVAISLWYDVGSKHEPAGRTGFAHLFEHLMFNGSANAPGDYFEPMKRIGATSVNGTTGADATNFFSKPCPPHRSNVRCSLKVTGWAI